MIGINLIIVIIITAIISYTLNTYLYEKLRDYSVISAAIIEEVLKTLGGFFVGYIFLTHAIFGVVEGLIDIRNNGKKGLLPSLFSLLGHASFGYITVVIYTITGRLIYGLLVGVFSHIIYNTLVVGIVNNLNNRS